MAEQHNVPAAWYPDHTDPSQLRWWDGTDWTPSMRPITGPVPTSPAAEHAPQFEAYRGLHAVAKPAEAFGHATADQLRDWAPPQPEQRTVVPAPAPGNDIPREWATNSSVDVIKGWMAKPVFQPVAVPIEDASPAVESYVDWQPAVPGWVAGAEPQSSELSMAELRLPESSDHGLAPSNRELADGLHAAREHGMQHTATMTRRQLRELVGGPLVTDAEPV